MSKLERATYGPANFQKAAGGILPTQFPRTIGPNAMKYLQEVVEGGLSSSAMVERFERDQLLKNPPIVVESSGKYILLDGATRITALKRVGCRDAVVQIVEYDAPGLVLETWNHMLIDLPLRDFFVALWQLPGLRVEPATLATLRARWPRMVENTAAPMNVKMRLTI
jgi:hypothetical protein